MLFVFLLSLVVGPVDLEEFEPSESSTVQNDISIAANLSPCRLRKARWPSDGTTLRCDSPMALINHLQEIAMQNISSGSNNATDFTSLDLICTKRVIEQFSTLKNNGVLKTLLLSSKKSALKYPQRLHSLSIQNCDVDSLDVLSLFAKVKVLNVSRNYFTTFAWQKVANMEIQILDLRHNFLDCSQCANKWFYIFSRSSVQKSMLHELWDARYIFHFIPQRIFIDKSSFRNSNNRSDNGCTFTHCIDEQVILDPITIDTVLGAPLQMECHYYAAPKADNLVPWENPFQWLLRDSDVAYTDITATTIASTFEMKMPLNEGTNITEHVRKNSPYSVQWRNKYQTAIYKKQIVTSDDLGFVACKCLICNMPIFNVSQVRFEVNVTAAIKDPVDGADDTQLIVHGYPLEQIQLRITRLSDNISEHQILSEHDSNSFFNDSFLVKYQNEHSHFFLKYYLLYIHQCADCNHAMLEGDYLLEICQKAGNDCVEIRRHFTLRTSNMMILSTTSIPVINEKGTSVFTYALILAFIVSISAILAWLASRGSWKMRRKLPLLHNATDWEFKRRRISRNTNRTEETSIPLEDTLSNTGLSTSYSFIAQHVPMIDPKELHVKYKIGRGAFGEVFTADWSMKKKKVAVKTLHIHMDAELDKEAAMLAKLDHRNVLKLYGISNLNGKIALVMEMMNQGDLKNYLRSREPRCDNYSQFPPALLQTELINISEQVCTGLSYLVSQQIVHRDLAARNCLVSGDSDANICSPAFRPSITIKISDFGMSRRLYSDAEYYRMHDSKTALPVRWLPPECLSFGKFTHQSDMWSFGVTLFEIFTYGGMPFGNLSNGEVLAAVVGGIRPELPPKCPEKIAEVIKQCWLDEPADRISADDALIKLRELH